jgi:hypothetical protein
MGLILIQDLEGLFGVGAGILLHLLGSAGAQFILIGRIADQRGVGADQEGHLVAQLLELAQLAHGDGVPQVQVAGARVVTTVDAQRAAFFLGFDQPLAQLSPHNYSLPGIIVAFTLAIHNLQTAFQYHLA